MQLKKQKNVGIRFDRNIYNTDDFFSAVIFCGTLQHLDEPFATIKSAVKSLKRGAHIFDDSKCGIVSLSSKTEIAHVIP